MEDFTKRVIKIIGAIPAGNVMTYGQIAGHAGSPRGARQVVRILHSMSKKYRLPWWRVINSKGQIGIKDEASFMDQKMLLEAESILFNKNGTIDLEKYRYLP